VTASHSELLQPVAILTHGTAWALALVPGVTIALTNRWYLLRRPGFWIAAVPVLVACVPWYFFTLDMVEDGWADISPWLQAPDFGRVVYLALGFPILLFALIGLWTAMIQVEGRAKVVPEWAALSGLAVAIFALHCIIPTGAESRYMVALVPSIVLLSAAGVDQIAHLLAARLPIGVVRVGSALALIAAFCAERFALPLQLRNGGYATLVRDVEARVSNAPQVWLISSGSTGEGCLVTAVALQKTRPNSYVLRGGTILAGGDWYWSHTQDRFDTPAKLAGLLDDIPVTIIVIDDRIPPNQQRPYQDRLRKLVAGEGRTKGAHRLISSNPGWSCVPEFVARLRSASGGLPRHRCTRDPAR
jgi:hypothetical protein